MDSKDIHRFASDRTISKVEDDLLGRANFSTYLAHAISSWHGKDSLVVALHGNWGSGKSSIKNMAIAKLESLEKDRPDIIEFTPWEWAAQDKITASFFQEVSSSIGRKDKSKSGKKLAVTLKKYGRYLNTGELIVTGFSAALPTSLIVVMDDLDRLTTEQLRMVFQLVKANVEFPNVVFLLLFQRDLVEEKLSDGKQSGRDFLEKIIQVPFDIPKIETTRVHSLFFSKLDGILEQDKSATEMFDSGYWRNIFYGSLYAYFDNLRNVYRFISTLSFHFSLLKGKTAFEVNPVDLIAIECLRIFEPDVYKEIARAKEIFTNNGSENYASSEESTKTFISGVVEKASEGKKNTVEYLIKTLFPTIEWALGGTNYSGDFGRSWLRDMRICHPSNFDKYFQFSIPSGELSNSDLREMLSLTSESEKLSSFILSLKERGILKNALAQFESFTDEVPLENGKHYIKGLLDIGDKVDYESIEFTMFSSNAHVVWLVVWFLRRINNIEERSKLLLECFKESDGISIVEHILQADENSREKSNSDIVLSDDEFTALKQEFVKKLNQMADNAPDNLMSHVHLVSFLYRWKRWGNEKKVISWVKTQTKNPEGCIKLLKAFVTRSSSQTREDYVAKITNHIDLESIENFIDIESIVQKVSGVNIEDLETKERKAIDVSNKAIEHREKGIADEW